MDVDAAVSDDARTWSTGGARAVVANLPRPVAVNIFGAFLTVQVRRGRLMTCLQDYIAALQGDSYLRKVETNLAVIDAGHTLGTALNNLEALVQPYNLLKPNAVQLTDRYVGGQKGPVVTQIEIERGISLTIDRPTAESFLHQMQMNTQSFTSAYQAFGDGILSAYGPEIISEAARVSREAQ
jgi:hypothetical protein